MTGVFHILHELVLDPYENELELNGVGIPVIGEENVNCDFEVSDFKK
jgi:hypothetical protein